MMLGSRTATWEGKNTEPQDLSGGSAYSGDPNFIRLTTLEQLVEVKID